MQDERIAVASRPSSLIATHKVLRNTYFLLSLTLLFSAMVATFAVVTNAPFLGIIPMLIGMFGLMFLTTKLRNSSWGLLSVFAFTGFLGYTLGPLLNVYLNTYANGGELIMTSLGATGFVFFGLSGYVLTTRKDFSFMSGFLVAGFMVLVLAIIGSFIFNIPGIQLAISAGIVLFASGSILFQTSRIIHGGETNYIMATMSLYISLYNLFINILHLLGAFSGQRN